MAAWHESEMWTMIGSIHHPRLHNTLLFFNSINTIAITTTTTTITPYKQWIRSVLYLSVNLSIIIPRVPSL